MSDEKKDLTRIEDLGEYIHELNAEDDFEGLPDLPGSESEEAPAFESEGEDLFGSSTEESSSDFGSTEEDSEESTDFGSTDFETSDFGSSETSEFGSSDFGSSDFGSSDFSSEESTFTDESPSFETSDFGSLEEETPVAESEEISSFEDKIVAAPELESEPQTEPEPEPEPIPEPEPTQSFIEEEPAPLASTPAPAPVQEYKAPENFEDIKKFAESTSFTGMGAEGNPSFSVLIKNVRYIEDVTDILALMQELGLQTDSEEQMKGRLMRGSLLVPRISEYAAILLAHKLRRFDVDIQVGLSDEIHPPKHKEEPETGLVSKFNLYQNQSHHFHFDDPKLEMSQIIVSATPSLEGHQVVRYLGVASEHKILDGHVVEDETSTEVPRHYQELAQKLKAHALKAHANAVVGLNYQLTPLPSEFGSSGSKYRLTCTGNLVWVNKI